MGMFDLLHSIADYIHLFFVYLGQLCKDTVFVINLLGSFFVHIPSYFSWLPSQLLTILVTLIGIVVVYKVLGREG